jgi:catecholate siderophore receptor
VIIQGDAPDDFRVEVPTLNRLTEPLVEIPQTIDILPQELLQDRGITNLNDALRSVPGISLGAGEFSFQGNAPSIRGFVARGDMFLDGIRDFGNYYRDAFNMQQIEVLEGPSSILFGRGSTGGVINQVSKLPTLDETLNGTLVFGSDATRRATVDWNEPLDGFGEGAAFRLTAMGHAANVAGRDVAEVARFGFAPSLALGIGTPTRLTGWYSHQSADDVPDYGLPWFGSAPAPVPRENFYGFTSDFLHTTADIGTIKVERDVGSSVILRDQLRYGYYTRDFRISEPIIAAPTTTPLESVDVLRNIWSGSSVETVLWNQADVTWHFETGPIGHAVVTGIEGGIETSEPLFENSSGVPTVPLLAPNPDMPFVVGRTFPRFNADTTGRSFAAYIIDTITLSERWEINAAFRWDYFEADYHALRYPLPPADPTQPQGQPTEESFLRIDRMPSYRGALVFKPRPNGSVYGAYGTSFNPSAESLNLITNARAFNTSNAFLAPEENQALELGTKWDLRNNQLSLTAAVFRLEKTNARVPDPNNPGFSILEGVQRVDGFDFSLTGRLTDNWLASVGYTFLDSHIVQSTQGGAPEGSPLVNTPKHSFTMFTEYRFGPMFELGGGATYKSSRLAQNIPPIKEVPAYWTFDLMAKYFFSDRWTLQLNVNNVFDKYYYEQLHPFHVVPGAGRVFLLTLNFQSG